MTGLRSGIGALGRSRFWAMPPTRCCHFSPRARRWRSRTPRCLQTPLPPIATTFPRPCGATSASASRARRACNARRAASARSIIGAGQWPTRAISPCARSAASGCARATTGFMIGGRRSCVSVVARACAPSRRAGEARHERFGRLGAAEQIALGLLGPQKLDLALLLLGLDALYHHPQAEAAGELADRLDDRAGGSGGGDVLGEAAVDLDLGERVAREVGERGVSGAEVVEREAHAD